MGGKSFCHVEAKKQRNCIRSPHHYDAYRMNWTVAHTEASLGWGGQEIRVFEEMKAMRDRGHRMLLVAQPHSKIFEYATQSGFQVFAMTADRLKYPGSILKLARTFRQHQVDVVNTHSSRDGYIGGIAARFARVPLIIRTRHIDVDYPNKKISRFGFHTLPHHVTTTSQLIVKKLIDQLGLRPDAVSCIPTGIDLDKYAPRHNESSPLRPALLTAGTSRLIGMVTVLRSWKGHRIFLEAIHALQKTDSLSDSHFIIAGEGPMRQLIESWIEELEIEDRVTLIGHREDVPELLRALDILVLPSYAHEGIPQIVLQAQASGTPVIGTTAGGIPEVITDEQTGLLVTPKDGISLAGTIKKLAENPELASRLAANALEFARTHHSLEKMCASTEKLYHRYLSGNEL
jgi:glycosyltransferase involved in cell wall biosynthesis